MSDGNNDNNWKRRRFEVIGKELDNDKFIFEEGGVIAGSDLLK